MKRQRPLQVKEIKILNKRLSYLDKRLKRMVRFLVIWTLLALAAGIFAYSRIERTHNTSAVVVTAVVYVGIGIWVFVGEYFGQRRQRKSIRFLKRKNLVTSVEVNSDRYYELVEEDDEGVYYLFQLPDDKIFSFGGQDFYANKKFPSNRFEIVEGRGFNNEIILLEIFAYGNKIQPIQTITGQQKWNMMNNPNYPPPHELTVVEGKIEDYFTS